MLDTQFLGLRGRCEMVEREVNVKSRSEMSGAGLGECRESGCEACTE